MDYKKLYAIQKENEKRILKVNKSIPHTSGIYVFARYENGIRFAYIGQAKDLLKRLAEHLSGYQQHIDLSIRKHKLYSESNPSGWNIYYYECPIKDLDSQERFFIQQYANNGYQLRNKTIGGQNEGKFGINENKASKSYRDGLKKGEENCIKTIRKYFEKYLDVKVKDNKKINERKLNEFLNYLKGDEKYD